METTPILRAALPVLLAACCLTAPTGTVQAQSTTPTLGCYVDTPAWDTPTEGYCEGVTPPAATIVFEVMYRQTPYSRYSYVWTGDCTGTSNYFCMIQNAAGSFSGRTYTATVLVTDNQTGLTYTTSASAVIYR